MPNLEQMNLKELRALASSLEIPNRSKLRKAELVLALLAAQQPTSRSTASRGASKTDAQQAMSEAHGQALGSSSSSTADQPKSPSYGPNGDPGLPLPDSYGRDLVVLMVQDPQHIYAWWELTGSGLNRLRAELGGNPDMVLILYGPQGSEQREVDFAAGNYYLSVAPEGSYTVALALRDSEGKLHLLAESQTVTTPPMGASSRIDEEWMAVDETFSELLTRAQLGDSEGHLSSAERLRQQHTRAWSQTPVHPWFSGHLLAPPSSLAMSSTTLSSHTLGLIPKPA